MKPSLTQTTSCTHGVSARDSGRVTFLLIMSNKNRYARGVQSPHVEKILFVHRFCMGFDLLRSCSAASSCKPACHQPCSSTAHGSAASFLHGPRLAAVHNTRGRQQPSPLLARSQAPPPPVCFLRCGLNASNESLRTASSSQRGRW